MSKIIIYSIKAKLFITKLPTTNKEELFTKSVFLVEANRGEIVCEGTARYVGQEGTFGLDSWAGKTFISISSNFIFGPDKLYSCTTHASIINIIQLVRVKYIHPFLIHEAFLRDEGYI